MKKTVKKEFGGINRTGSSIIHEYHGFCRAMDSGWDRLVVRLWEWYLASQLLAVD